MKESWGATEALGVPEQPEARMLLPRDPCSVHAAVFKGALFSGEGRCHV